MCGQAKRDSKSDMLLTEDTKMPETNIGDLRDVVDAINRLCDNMKPNYDSKSDSFVSFDTGSQEVPCLSHDVVMIQDVTNLRSNPDVDGAVDEYGYFDDIRNKYVENAWFENSKKAQEVDQADKAQIVHLELTQADISGVVSQTIKNEHLEEVVFKKMNVIAKKEDSVHVDVRTSDFCTDRWSDNSQVSLLEQTVELIPSDIETVLAHCETASEVYYSASSEVSLTSDIETAERMEDSMFAHDKMLAQENALLIDDQFTAQNIHLNRDNSLTISEIRNERDCVVSGHVAAMRERFENMTRSNTPSDLFRSFSPSLDRVSPTPDLKGQ